MTKKSGIVFVIIGAALMLLALSLLFYNWYEDAQAGWKAGELLTDVQTVIKEKKMPAPAGTESLELPVTEIDGYGYVGYLSIPDLELELPVMSEWDYARLKIAPCRQFGSTGTDDLVIAAHNYKNRAKRCRTREV